VKKKTSEKKVKKSGRKRNGDCLNPQFFTTILFFTVTMINHTWSVAHVSLLLSSCILIVSHRADDGEKAWFELRFLTKTGVNPSVVVEFAIVFAHLCEATLRPYASKTNIQW